MKRLSSLLIGLLLLQSVSPTVVLAVEYETRPSVRQLKVDAMENALKELRSKGLSADELKKHEAVLLEEQSDLKLSIEGIIPGYTIEKPVVQEAPIIAPAPTVTAAPVVSQQFVADIAPDLPAFPEDAVRPEIDWSSLDWDKQIVTPDAEQEYNEKRAELLAAGKDREAKLLKKRTEPLYGSGALQFLKPPADVLDAVETYGEQVKEADEEAAKKNIIQKLFSGDAKEEFKEQLIERLKGESSEAAVSTTDAEPVDENVIDLTLKKVEPAQMKNYLPTTEQLDASVEGEQHELQQSFRTNAFPQGGFSDLQIAPPGPKESAKAGWLSYIVPTVLASPGSTLMGFYADIINFPIDRLLLYVASTQNSDGSMGDNNQYYHTFRTVEALSQMDKAYTDEYAKMVDYLRTTVPTNNRDKAFKARILQSLGQSPAALMDDLASQFTAVAVDGIPRIVGIGLLPGHEPDIESMIAFADAALMTGLHTDLLPYTIIWISNRVDPTGYIRYNADGLPSYQLVNTVAQQLLRFRGMTYTFATQTVVIDQKIALLMQYLRGSFTGDTQLLRGNHDVVDELMTLKTFEMYAGDADITHALREAAVHKQNFDGSFGSSLYASEAALFALRKADVRVLDIAVTRTENHQPIEFSLNVQNTGQLPLWSLKLHVFADKVFLGTQTIALSTPIQQFTKRSIPVVLPASFSSTLLGPVKLSAYIEVPSEAEENDNWIQTDTTFAPSSVQMSGALPPAYPMLKRMTPDTVSGDLRITGQFVFRADPRRSSLMIVVRHVESGATYTATVPTSGLINGNTYGFSAITNISQTDDVTAQLVATLSSGTQYGEAPVPMTRNSHGSVNFTAWKNSTVLPNTTMTTPVDTLITNDQGQSTLDDTNTGLLNIKVADALLEPLTYRYVVTKNTETKVGPVMTRALLDSDVPLVQEVRLRGSPTQNVFHSPGTFTVEIDGSDNNGIKDAEIEYWNPFTSQWMALAVIPFETATSGIYNWSVPGSLIGTGFKVRARVSDFIGNKSTYRESGTFEFKGSSVISIPGLVNGTWGLGQTKTVNFDFSSIPSFDSVDGIYLNVGTNRFNMVPGSFSTPTKDVTMSLHGSRLGENTYLEARIYSEGFSKQTNVFSPSFNVIDTTPAPQAPWHAPTTFLDPTPASLLSRTFYYIQERSDGGADVVYSEIDGLAGVSTQEWRRLVFRSLRGGVWQPPVIIDQRQVTGEANRWTPNRVIVREDNGGGLHLLYRLESYMNSSMGQVFFAEVRNQRLIGAQELTSGATTTTFSAFAISKDGGAAIAAWSENGSSSLGTLSARRRVGGTWTAKELLSSSGDYPALTTDGTTASVTFLENSGLKYRRFDGSAWSAAQPVRGLDGQELHSVLGSALFSRDDGAFDIFFMNLQTNVIPLRNIRFEPGNPTGPVTVLRDQNVVNVTSSSSVRNFAIVSPASGQYHILYEHQTTDSLANGISYVGVSSDQVIPGSNVFSLITDGRGPLLTFFGNNLAAFALVQNAGFDDYVIKRNEASILSQTQPLTPPDKPDLLAADDTGISDTDNITSKTTGLRFDINSCQTAATLRLFINGAQRGSAICNGTTTVTMTGALAAGTYSVTARQTTTAGMTSAFSSPLSVTITGTASTPAAPDLVAEDDTGSSSTDNITTRTSGLRFTVSTCTSAATVQLFSGSVMRGGATCTASGITLTMTGGTLARGTYAFRTRQIDAAGSVSAFSSALTVVITTIATVPGTPDLIAAHDYGTSNADNLTNKTSGLKFDVSSCESGSRVKLFSGSVMKGSGTCTATGVTITMTGSALQQGIYGFRSQQQSGTNPASGFSTPLTITIDTFVAPSGTPDLVAADDTGISSTDNITSKNTGLRFDISCEVGGLVQLLSGSLLKAGAICSTGSVTFTLSETLVNGNYTLKSQQSDAAGNLSIASATLTMKVDAAIPVRPNMPDLVAADDTGSGSTDNITMKTTGLRFVVTGCQAGNTVKLFAGSVHRGTGACTATGVTISMTGATALSNGFNAFSATQTNAVGAASLQSNLLTVTIDTATDTAQITIPGSGATIGSRTISISGSAESGATVQLYRWNGTTPTLIATTRTKNIGFTTNVTFTADGVFVISAKATDAAGNVSQIQPKQSVIIDTVAPAAPVISTPATNSIIKSLTVAFVGTSEASARVRIFSGAVQLGEFQSIGTTWTGAVTLPRYAKYTFTAKAVDRGGNIGPASTAVVVTLNNAAPLVPVMTKPTQSFRSKSSWVTFSGTADAGTRVDVYSGSTVIFSKQTVGTTWSGSLLMPDGKYIVTAKAVDSSDRASNPTAKVTLYVDTGSPTPTIASPGSGALLKTRTITVVGSAESGSTVRLYRYTGTTQTLIATVVSKFGTFTAPFTISADGVVVIAAQATDVTGNLSAFSPRLTFWVDSIAPAIPVINTPAANSIIKSLTLSLQGTAEANALVRIFSGAVQVGELTANPAGTWSGSLVFTKYGRYSITAKAVDKAGNISASNTARIITLSNAAPLVPVMTKPTQSFRSKSSWVTFSGTADAGTRVDVYSGSTVIFSKQTVGTTWSGSLLMPDGKYIVTAKAVDSSDRASNPTAKVTLYVDTRTSTPVIVFPGSGSTLNTRSTTVIGSAESGSTVRLYRYTGTTQTLIATVVSKFGTFQAPVSFLADGVVTLSAQATDLTGNLSALSPKQPFTIDTVRPGAPGNPDLLAEDDTGNSQTDNLTSKRSGLRFQVACETGGIVQLSIAGINTLGNCVNGLAQITLSNSSLADGTYPVGATQTDAGGNSGTGASGILVTIDSSAPSSTGTPNLAAISDTGFSNSDNLTRLVTGLQFDVPCQSGHQVKLFFSGVHRGTAQCTSASVNITMTGGLLAPSGTYIVTANQTDAAGNTSVNAPNDSFVVDAYMPAQTAAPDLRASSDTGGGSTDNITGESSNLVFDVGGCENGGYVYIYSGSTFGGGASCNSGMANLTAMIGEMPNGYYRFKTVQVDYAGNVSADSPELLVRVAYATTVSYMLSQEPASGALESNVYGTYQQVHDAQSGYASMSYIMAGQAVGANFNIQRAKLVFDTSPLPDNAKIQSAAIMLYIDFKYATSGATKPTLVVVPMAGNTLSLNASEYSAMYATNIGSLGYDSFANGAYSTIPLTSTLQVNPSARSMFGLRSVDDISSTAPTTGSQSHYFYSNVTTGHPPILQVTYRVPLI